MLQEGACDAAKNINRLKTFTFVVSCIANYSLVSFFVIVIALFLCFFELLERLLKDLTFGQVILYAIKAIKS